MTQPPSKGIPNSSHASTSRDWIGVYVILIIVVAVLIVLTAMTQYASLSREIPPPWFLEMVTNQERRIEEQDKKIADQDRRITILMERFNVLTSRQSVNDLDRMEKMVDDE